MSKLITRLRRVDANQKEIVSTLRKLGIAVAITSGVGQGFPDIVCGYRGVNYLFEIKDENKPPSERELTEKEQKFFNNWRGQIAMILNAQEAIDIMTADADTNILTKRPG